MSAANHALERSVNDMEACMADNREKLSERAYHLWKESGEQHGRDMEHWLRAERELADKPGAKPATPKKAAAPKKAAEAKTASPAKKAPTAAKKPATPATKKAAPARKPKTPA